MLDLSQTKLHIPEATLHCIITCLAQHIRGHIDTDDMTRLPHLMGGKKTVESTASTEIDHQLSRLERGNCLWITTAQSHVGTTGHLGQFIFTVPQAGRDEGIDRLIV